MRTVSPMCPIAPIPSAFYLPISQKHSFGAHASASALRGTYAVNAGARARGLTDQPRLHALSIAELDAVPVVVNRDHDSDASGSRHRAGVWPQRHGAPAAMSRTRYSNSVRIRRLRFCPFARWCARAHWPWTVDHHQQTQSVSLKLLAAAGKQREVRHSTPIGGTLFAVSLVRDAIYRNADAVHLCGHVEAVALPGFTNDVHSPAGHSMAAQIRAYL
ncbi:hypothetical protein DENSPDRAFT_454400 [Dentipellis sp. KUC8613]|nr:hypothetical protein DENSPDRAFT_454400 [Dentipellis sp. KUC8613]